MNYTSDSCWLLVGAAADWRSANFWVILILAGLFTLMVIGGNSLVIIAVATYSSLHTTTNFLIVSLAVSDLSLGLFILPFSIFLLLSNQVWPFGSVWCHMYLAIDVWMSTASIYNLLAISFDRFMALWQPLKYKLIASSKLCHVLVACAYIIPLVVALPPVVMATFSTDDVFKESHLNSNGTRKPVLNWSHVQEADAATVSSQCNCSPMNNSQAYVIYSAMSSFFLPLFFIIALNGGIYLKARQISELHRNFKLKKKAKEDAALQQLPDSSRHLTAVASLMVGRHVKEPKKKEQPSNVLRVHRGGQFNPIQSPEKSLPSLTQAKKCRPVVTRKRSASQDLHSQRSIQRGQTGMSARKSSVVVGSRLQQNAKQPNLLSASPIIGDAINRGVMNTRKRTIINIAKLTAKKKRVTQRNETRVAKTVGIVIGCFIVCWLPFSLLYFIQAFVGENIAETHPILFSIAFWLGYFNSGVNPAIYACCSRDFRKAFKRTLNACFSRPNRSGLMSIVKKARVPSDLEFRLALENDDSISNYSMSKLDV